MMKRLGNICLSMFIVVLSLFFAVGCDESKPQEKKGNIKILVSSNQKGVDLFLYLSDFYNSYKC